MANIMITLFLSQIYCINAEQIRAGLKNHLNNPVLIHKIIVQISFFMAETGWHVKVPQRSYILTGLLMRSQM